MMGPASLHGLRQQRRVDSEAQPPKTNTSWYNRSATKVTATSTWLSWNTARGAEHAAHEHVNIVDASLNRQYDGLRDPDAVGQRVLPELARMLPCEIPMSM